MFSLKVCKIFKNIYFEEHLRTTASKEISSALLNFVDKKYTKQSVGDAVVPLFYHKNLQYVQLITKVINRGIIERKFRTKKSEFRQEPEHFHLLAKCVTIRSDLCYFLHASNQCRLYWRVCV